VACRWAILAASVLAGQTPAPTFRTSTRLIEVSVIVHDKKGEPVAGLTKDQFTLFDQGVAQRIVFFAEQSSAPSQPSQVQTAGTHVAASGANIFSNRSAAGTRAGAVTAILFDSLNTDFLDSGFARARVEKFLKAIQPEDRIALYGLSTTLQVLHDFTDDADALTQALDRFKASENVETSSTKFKESNIGSVADGINNDINQRVSDMYMASRVANTAGALEAIAKHMAGLPGRKNLVWVSGSFPMSIGYFQKRLPGTRPDRQAFEPRVEAAARALSGANVAIYPVDARALTTLGGAFNAATSPRMTAGPVKPARPPELAPIGDLGTMETLADATGGRVFANTNDIDGAVRSAIDDGRSTYVLGYYPDHNQWDGSFREIKVQVKRSGAASSLETRYRRGYMAFADTPLDSNRAPLKAADAIAGPLGSTELGLTVQVEPLIGPGGTRQIKAHLKFDTAAMRFEQKDGRWIDDLDVLWVQLDAADGMIVSNGQTLTLRLSPETYQSTAENGVKMSSVEPIEVQTVELRFVARDRGTGALGSITIPLRTVFGPPR
jgi:VWFA-related protein